MAVYDLPTLFSFREAFERLDESGPPRIEMLRPAPPCGSVALLPGSFNPPTAAHLLLAERARREGFDCVAFLLAKHTAGKSQAGLVPEDRLLALRMIASPPHVSVGVSSHALYSEQAEAAARAFPGAQVAFLVGSDKVIQIFEHKWYDDRDAALERLFSRASLLVSPRADEGERVREMVEAPENRRFADRISVLRLHPAVGDLSSTRVRGLLQSGADPSGLVPASVASLLAEVRAFSQPVMVGDHEVDAYQVRSRLLGALWPARRWAEEGADLRRLLGIALAPGPAGDRLRALLWNGMVGAEELARLQAAG